MDLTFKTQKGKFNYRVGAIIIKDGKLLMVRNTGSDYYYSVGGRVKFDEDSENAVIRETAEETGAKMSVDRLIAIHENFFTEKEHYHEISFYYIMNVPENFVPLFRLFSFRCGFYPKVTPTSEKAKALNGLKLKSLTDISIIRIF